MGKDFPGRKSLFKEFLKEIGCKILKIEMRIKDLENKQTNR